jgi:hypothetical protein
MLIVPPPKVRKSRWEPKGVVNVSPPSPVPLTLQAASYDPIGLTLTLVFDRAIDVSGFDGSQVTVNDGAYNLQAYSGADSPTLSDAVTVVIVLDVVMGTEAGDVTMDASPASGIAAVDDGGTWDGASSLVLPFSS